jgi:hypothetical protein
LLLLLLLLLLRESMLDSGECLQLLVLVLRIVVGVV